MNNGSESLYRPRTPEGTRHVSQDYRHFARFFVIATMAIAASWTEPGHANAPDGHYTSTNGTIYDTKTMLTWERAPTLGPVSWDDANMYCAKLGIDGKVWRLPSMKELQTIVDRTLEKPAIDPVFMNTAPEPFMSPAPFWTSSPLADMASTVVWTVDFTDGTTGLQPIASPARVRCVY